jgi:hypothetical protein
VPCSISPAGGVLSDITVDPLDWLWGFTISDRPLECLWEAALQQG